MSKFKHIQIKGNNIFSASDIQKLSPRWWNWWTFSAVVVFAITSICFRLNSNSIFVEQTPWTIIAKNILNLLSASLIVIGITNKKPKFKNIPYIWPVMIVMIVIMFFIVVSSTSFYELLYDTVFLQFQEWITSMISQVEIRDNKYAFFYILAFALFAGLFKAVAYTLFIFIWIEGIKPLHKKESGKRFKFIGLASKKFFKNFWLIVKINLAVFVILAITIIIDFLAFTNSAQQTVSTWTTSHTDIMGIAQEIQDKANSPTRNLISGIIWNAMLYLKVVATVLIFSGYKYDLHIDGLQWRFHKGGLPWHH